MAPSHTEADESTDENSHFETAEIGDWLERDRGALVETIANAGPDDARTVIPTAQAEALVARDVLGMSRPAAAETLAVSVYAIDDRLRRARDNTQAAVATTRALLETDAVHEDADDDLDALRNLLEYEDEEAEDAAESEPDTGVGLDVEAAWGRLMMLEATHEVTRGNGAVSVTLDDPDDVARETVVETLDGLGLEVVDRTEYGTGGRETIRATRDAPEDVEALETDEETASTAESEADDEADPEPDDPADRRNVLLLGDTPIPDRTDRLSDDDLDELAATVERTLAVDLDDLENGQILGSITLEGDTWSFNPAEELAERVDQDDAHAGEDDDADEADEEEAADGYTCEDCGDTFDSPAGLGGHRKYCPERPETDG